MEYELCLAEVHMFLDNFQQSYEDVSSLCDRYMNLYNSSWIEDIPKILQGCHGQGKSSGKWKMFQVREKSGNFIFSQGNLEKMKKVMEKSGNFKNFRKNASKLASGFL